MSKVCPKQRARARATFKVIGVLQTPAPSRMTVIMAVGSASKCLHTNLLVCGQLENRVERCHDPIKPASVFVVQDEEKGSPRRTIKQSKTNDLFSVQDSISKESACCQIELLAAFVIRPSHEKKRSVPCNSELDSPLDRAGSPCLRTFCHKLAGNLLYLSVNLSVCLAPGDALCQ